MPGSYVFAMLVTLIVECAQSVSFYTQKECKAADSLNHSSDASDWWGFAATLLTSEIDLYSRCLERSLVWQCLV